MKKWFLYGAIVFLCAGCHSLRVIPEEQVFIPMFEPKKPIEVALVLGGGGSKGLAHLGAIQELEKAGIRPDLIVGCSAGAIAGAFYADQPDLEDAADKLIPLRKADLLDYSFANPVFGIVHGDLLQEMMRKMIHAKRFEELEIPLIVVTTDLISGDLIEISSGDLSSAIRASCAVPGVFKPVSLYGRHCVDGGVASPLPVQIARKYGAQLVIAIDLSSKLSEEHPQNLLGVTKRSLEIAYRKFIEHSITQADIGIRMDFEEISLFDDEHNEWIYEQGKAVVKKHLAKIQEQLALLRSHHREKQDVADRLGLSK